MTTPLVSETYLKTLLPISASIDVTMLVPHVESSQIIWMREILGRELYDDIITKFVAQTLSSDEIELVSYMKPAIAYRTAYEALPFLSIQIKPKGAVKLRGEFEDQATLSEMKYLRDALEAKSQYYEERVTEYLCLNGSRLFPLYGKTDEKTGVNSDVIDAYNSDIYIDTPVEYVRELRKYISK